MLTHYCCLELYHQKGIRAQQDRTPWMVGAGLAALGKLWVRSRKRLIPPGTSFLHPPPVEPPSCPELALQGPFSRWAAPAPHHRGLLGTPKQTLRFSPYHSASLCLLCFYDLSQVLCQGLPAPARVTFITTPRGRNCDPLHFTDKDAEVQRG